MEMDACPDCGDVEGYEITHPTPRNAYERHMASEGYGVRRYCHTCGADYST